MDRSQSALPGGTSRQVRVLLTVALALVAIGGMSPVVGSVTGLQEDGQADEDDRFEPNDDREAAADIQSGETCENLQLLDGESDHFAVSLAADEQVTVTVDFEDGNSDLGVIVRGQNGGFLGRSASFGDEESVTFETGSNGTYYVEVFGDDGASSSYSLEVSSDENTAQDSGDGDLRTIEIGETASGEIDRDDPQSEENRGYHEPVRLDGSAGDLVTISMESIRGDTYLVLRGPDGAVIERDDDGGNGLNSEISGVRLPEDGEYTIAATSYRDFDTFEYTLSVDHGTSATARPAAMDLAVESERTGDAVTVTYNLTNTGSEAEPFIVETGLRPLPEGWSITDHSETGATWRGADGAWVFGAVAPNKSVQPSVTLSVPPDASTRQFLANAYAQRGETTASYSVETDV